ncbi:hypothetical protein EVAR_98787_1 [Eumeta japonica]|uniref:Uncharacterized protein n=1 Tax=Eumeta variegata TaxID=151549 RepID=A0A4C2A0D6_EUMVA|nr:hypothetical protein EVAR_98787_1 [Eumeta japonica]
MAEAVVEHAVAGINDDSWLYGDSNPEQTENKDAENGEKDQQDDGTDVTEVTFTAGVGIVAAAASAQDKSRANALPGSKVTLEDLEGPGSINGVPEFNIDTIETSHGINLVLIYQGMLPTFERMLYGKEIVFLTLVICEIKKFYQFSYALGPRSPGPIYNGRYW